MSGSLSHSPADIVRQLLVDLGFGTLPSASDTWPIYVYREPASPDDCVTLYDTEGSNGPREMTGGYRLERHGFQIRIRCDDSRQGWEKAHELAIALDQSIDFNSVTLSDRVGTGTTDYTVYSVVRTGDVLSIGKAPESKRSIYTINATVALRQTS